MRRIYSHLGVFPESRGHPYHSMDLLRHVLQPSINDQIFKIMNKYVEVVKEASENTKKNFAQESFEVDAEHLVVKFFTEAFEDCKKSFTETIRSTTTQQGRNMEQKNLGVGVEIRTLTPYQQHGLGLNVNSPPPHQFRQSILGKHRADSPDYLNKRGKEISHGSPRRSLSPATSIGKKGGNRAGTPVGTSKAYNSPYRQLKSEVKRKIENWDPNTLTTETKFVMGTKANKALGLGATRGRIYMKHPELFKYSGDHEDKKWMVKNNCMQATGGKNTFIMIADDVVTLYQKEYKDCHGTKLDELTYFCLPDFVLEKMKSAMANDKQLRVAGLPPTGRPPEECKSLRHYSAKKSTASKPPPQQQQQHTFMTSVSQQRRPNVRGVTSQLVSIRTPDQYSDSPSDIENYEDD